MQKKSGEGVLIRRGIDRLGGCEPRIIEVIVKMQKKKKK